MQFDLSPSQQRWQEAAIRFAQEELADDTLIARDEARAFWKEGWVRCARFGVQGLPIPPAYGGQGEGLPATIAAMEGLGYGAKDSGLIMTLNSCLWTVSLPIAQFGSEAQKQRWLPGLCDGSLVGANGASEPEAGSDIYRMTARAERKGDSWVLNGRKTWITGGPVADVFVCYASTAPEKGILGLSAFIVPKDAPGLRLVKEIPKLGLRTAPMGELALENCELPADARLGPEGRGAELFRASMEWERGALLASTLGTMKRQIERCVEFARSREQFGAPIGSYQAISHRIAEMYVRLETCRPLVYRIGWLKSQDRDATTEASVAKLHLSECFVQNSLDAVRIFGARGYATEFEIERDLRDSVGSLIYSGTNDIQKNIIAQRLRLSAKRGRG